MRCGTCFSLRSEAGRLSSRLRQRTHAALSTSSSSQPKSSHPLIEWVGSRGGKVDGSIAVVDMAGRNAGSGFGLIAVENISTGQKLVELPSLCLLTYDASSTKANDAALLQLINKVPQELWGAKLALQLLVHRVAGPDSPFATYISQLPIGISGVPTFFTKAGLDAIQYPPVGEQVKKRCRWLADFSQKDLSALPGSAADPFSGVKVDINALGWAMACVSSRAFRVRGRPSEPAAALLPLIDMCNHSFEPNCQVLPVDNSKGAMGMFAKRKIEAGEPLLLSYGNLSNDFLFMDYGFIIDGNPHDRVTLRFDIDLMQAGAELGRVRIASAGPDGGQQQQPVEFAPLPCWKTRWLQEARLAGSTSDLEVSLGGPQHVDARLLAAARVLCATNASEIEGRNPQRLGDLFAPLSRANETAALRTLTGVALVALGSFPTTLQQDEALLQPGGAAGQQQGQSSTSSSGSGDASSATAGNDAQQQASAPLPDDVKLAVRFRMGKKRLLSEVVQALGERIKQLPQDTSIPATTAPGALQKGQKPSAASTRGFGTRK